MVPDPTHGNQPRDFRDFVVQLALVGGVLLVGGAILALALVFLGPDNDVECGGQTMEPGDYCVSGPPGVPVYGDPVENGRSYEEVRDRQQSTTDALGHAIRWIVASVGIMVMVGGLTLLLLTVLPGKRQQNR